MARVVVVLVVIMVAVAGLLAMSGILRFESTPDQTIITVDKAELREKGRDVLQKTEEASKDVLNRADDTLREAGNDLRKATSDRSSNDALRP